jgi:uncharacterized protein YraI
MQSIAHGQVMRRTISLRTTLHVLIALLLTALLPARAEEVVSIVTELAPGDLLNVRATASAMGKIKARLPNGTSVNNLGCNDVNGYRWCKVAEIDNPQLSGWAPARYLNPENPTAVSDEETETTGESAAPAAEASNPATADQPLPDLTARLGASGPEPTMTAAEAIGRAAIEDAYRLALAASANPIALPMRRLRPTHKPLPGCSRQGRRSLVPATRFPVRAMSASR